MEEGWGIRGGLSGGGLGNHGRTERGKEGSGKDYTVKCWGSGQD